MAFFEYFYERPARRHYRCWRSWATRCRLKPVIEKARMIHRRFENIITYLRHRITNAASESINSKIQWVSTLHAAFAVPGTLPQPSTSIAAASILCLTPTKFPECTSL